MMKVKARDTGVMHLTADKLYNVIRTESYDLDYVYQYYVINDLGIEEPYHHSHFTIIPDTPQIEVGSEWVNINDDEYIATITAVGNERLLYVGKFSGEASYRIDSWLMYYKPKPKTVTMYFYKASDRIVAFNVESTCYGPLLFTREIEL